MDPLTTFIGQVSFGVFAYLLYQTMVDINKWLGQLLEGRMPRGTVSKDTERFDLKTLEGGYVVLRRLSYGEKLRKDAEAMKFKFDMDFAKGDPQAEIAMINVAVQQSEMAKCVVEHNITKPNPDPNKAADEANDVLVNFQVAADIDQLDPKVGDEISQLIGQMNDFVREATESKLDGKGK